MLCCPPLASGRSACPARLRAPLDPPPSLVAPSSLLSPVGGGALWLAGARTSFPRRFAPRSSRRRRPLARGGPDLLPSSLRSSVQSARSSRRRGPFARRGPFPYTPSVL